MKTYIDDLRRLSHLVDVVLDGWVVRSDPNDDPVVYTAVDGKADVLCTRDRHFFEPAVIAFCRGNHIRVMNELELLRLLTPRT